MKTIGIITHYYKSLNYGGVLQSYALCQYLNQKGFNAEQVKYKQAISFLSKFKRLIKKILMLVFSPIISIKNIKKQCLFFKFRNKIPHYAKTMTAKKISRFSKYDILLTGSDQVWNPNVICDAYCLNFSYSSLRASYAASLASDKINQDKIHFYKSLNNLDYISVREKQSVPLLKNYIKKPISICCDPVFLLEKEVWLNKLQSFSHKRKYLFCYFLGKNDLGRIAANYIAKIEDLEIINLAYGAEYNKIDKILFKRKEVVAVDPFKFLSLINDAEIILTDSFHAVAFSIIFDKKFVAFQRDEKVSMENRIVDLLHDFDMNNRLYLNNNDTEFQNFYSNLFSSSTILDSAKLNEYKNSGVNFLRKVVEHDTEI